MCSSDPQPLTAKKTLQRKTGIHQRYCGRGWVGHSDSGSTQFLGVCFCAPTFWQSLGPPKFCNNVHNASLLCMSTWALLALAPCLRQSWSSWNHRLLAVSGRCARVGLGATKCAQMPFRHTQTAWIRPCDIPLSYKECNERCRCDCGTQGTAGIFQGRHKEFWKVERALLQELLLPKLAFSLGFRP